MTGTFKFISEPIFRQEMEHEFGRRVSVPGGRKNGSGRYMILKVEENNRNSKK